MKKIKENTAEIYTKKGIFYNPHMEFCRDISSLAVGAIKDKLRICDGFSATGIRGIRIANEVDGDIEIHINDCNPKSYEIIKKNVEINGISAYIYNKHFCSVVQEKNPFSAKFLINLLLNSVQSKSLLHSRLLVLSVITKSHSSS